MYLFVVLDEILIVFLRSIDTFRGQTTAYNVVVEFTLNCRFSKRETVQGLCHTSSLVSVRS